MPIGRSITIDPLTPVGRRPSGARLYHAGSRFGEPARRKIDRERVAQILFLAEALDRRTRRKGEHGGVLKGKGLDVLRALLRRFFNKATGECFPSYDTIAEAAGCCRDTVRRKIKALELAGIIEIVRRKAVATFVSAVHRIRFDVAVQTSNSYVFNIPLPDRAQYGDLALPLFRPREPEAEFRSETSVKVITTPAPLMDPDLAAALDRYGHMCGAR